MDLSGLLALIRDIPAYQELLVEIRERQVEENLSILRAARPYLIAALAQDLQRPIVLAVARPEQVSSTVEQIGQWLPSPWPVLRFAEPEALPYERIPWAAETVRDRLAVLAALVAGQPDGEHAPIVVASGRALMQPTIPRREFALGTRVLKVGQRVVLPTLLSSWMELGYQVTSVVEDPGTFSRRGGIVDVFAPGELYPVRIELFGDEVDSLRVFDPATQRSLYRVESWTIPPASEALPKFGHLAVEKLAQLDPSTLHGPASAEYRADLDALRDGGYFKGIEFYIPYLYSRPGTLLDYVPPDGVVIVDDQGELGDSVAELEAQALDLQGSLETSGELLTGFARPYLTWDELHESLEDRRPLYLGYGRDAGWLEEEEEEEEEPSLPADGEMPPAGHRLAADSEARGVLLDTPGSMATSDVTALRAHFALGQRYGGQLRRVIEAWSEMRRAGRRVVAVSRQAQRLSELWDEQAQRVHPVDGISELVPRRSLTLVQGALDEGWALLQADGAPALDLFTDAEIFGWSKPRPRRLRRKPVHPEVFFADLNPGDYVVHMDFGIGVFRGLTKATIDGGEREYLRVDYAGEDTVYVPIHHADRLSRYVGASDRPAALNRLGTTDWAGVKERAKKAAVDVAKDLLALYSARQVVPGFAFSPDTEWQAELEASFAYIETDDQLQAISDVKVDMEQQRPMDRLICGDVGYGKTEVALRAAFKAAMDGKQVAVLVPTTVLAQQHLTTFRRRLAPFPVHVEMLSRFRTAKEQRDVIQGLSSGTVDVVIGTHRLLSEDVMFKDLGFLIIDEEQRFGVTHKERLKQMRTEVDVLTMTATPIPRTLYMSLAGARDMSTIDTPPEERLPIKTHVGQYDETLIRKALLRELDRGGQVFFVHNRVRGIQQVRQHLEQIVPEATYAIGHGQMHERELEQVMLDFAEGNIDVLVCTTIIESGLDIPNANTIIVNRADRFGLAQLYQLRGRVGRGANRAYAYFLYGRSAKISETARRRLQAILEASDLGAGFSVAMRDLEIRGAGDLLGTRQHGHIAAVGFDLYCRLLAQAVSELKGESPRSLTDEARAYTLPLEQSVQITLPLDASFPEDYIPDEALRLQLYRRLSGMLSMREIDDLRAELTDRFGPMPEAAENLLYQLRLKIVALEASVEAIVVEHRDIVIRVEALESADRAALQAALGDRAKVRRREVRLPLGSEAVWRAELARALERIREVTRTAVGVTSG
jgi:transcription-repair coupling factor (superfamily II helicase)